MIRKAVAVTGAINRKAAAIGQWILDDMRALIAKIEDFLHLSKEFKILEQKYQSVLSDNQALTSQLIEMSESKVVRIPSFLRCHRH